MDNLSIGWAEYARAQEELNNSKTLNDRHRGLEYALDKILDDIEEDISFDRSDVERRIQTGARQNRHRLLLIRLQLPTWQLETNDPTQLYESRLELIFLHTALGDNDYDLLRRVAEGRDNNALADEEGLKAPAFRKRVSRIRCKARTLLSDE